MFYGASVFSQDIGGWDTAAVTDMGDMFYNADAFDQNIGAWDTSSATDLSQMFRFADGFNQAIGGWDVSSVTTMRETFKWARAFNQDIGDWDVSSVTTMRETFNYAGEFNADLGDWDVSRVTAMNSMFHNAKFNQDIGGWDVSRVTNMYFMLQNTPFDQCLPSDFDPNGHMSVDYSTTRVRDKAELVAAVNAWTSTPEAACGHISTWDVSRLTDMAYLFCLRQSWMVGRDDWADCQLTDETFNAPIGGWDTSKVTDMNNAFRGATDFDADIGAWDVSKVTDMNSTFMEAKSFNADIGEWDVSGVTEMANAFRDAIAFNQDISAWDASKFSSSSMSRMLDGADAFDQCIPWHPVYRQDAYCATLPPTSAPTASPTAALGDDLWSKADIADAVTVDVGGYQWQNIFQKASLANLLPDLDLGCDYVMTFRATNGCGEALRLGMGGGGGWLMQDVAANSDDELYRVEGPCNYASESRPYQIRSPDPPEDCQLSLTNIQLRKLDCPPTPAPTTSPTLAPTVSLAPTPEATPVPTAAGAVVVTVEGVTSVLTVNCHKYNGNANKAKFKTWANGGVMPWWNNYVLAKKYMAAVKAVTDLPNDDDPWYAKQPDSYFPEDDMCGNRAPSACFHYEKVSNGAQWQKGVHGICDWAPGKESMSTVWSTGQLGTNENNIHATCIAGCP